MPPPPQPGGYGGGGGFQPPPAQPYGGGGVPSLDVGQAVSYGWSKFQQWWKEFVILVLVVFLVTAVVNAISWFALIPALSGDNAGMIIAWIAYALALLLTLAVSFIVQAGVYRAGLGVTRGQAPSLSMLTETENIGAYVLTVILVAIGAAIGFILCIIPGIIWLFFTAYAPLLALDKGMGAVDSIKRSIEMVRSNIGQVLLLLLAAYVIYYVGAILCYVGLLVTIPVALVTITYSYRALQGEPVAP